MFWVRHAREIHSLSEPLGPIYDSGHTRFAVLGPDYMSRADPVSRSASVCRDDFLSGIT